MEASGTTFVVWLAFLLTAGLIQSANACKDVDFLPCIKNKTLTGHVIKTVNLLEPAEEMCQNHCFNDDRCVSYNIGERDGVIQKCELNDFDHVMFPNDLIDKNGTEYCPFEHPCSSNPCPSGKLCVPDFNLNTFNCHDAVWGSWGPICKCPTTRARTRVCRSLVVSSSTPCPGSSQDEVDINQPYEKVPKDCLDAAKCGCRESGVYSFSNIDGLGEIKLYCDHDSTAFGGWTVIQKRKDGSVDFYRGWQDYKNGFGDLNGEFWLGLDKIHQLTNRTRHRLRIDLEDAEAVYDYFAVESEADLYTLRLGTYMRGTAGDSLKKSANMAFTTKDRDNDIGPANCAVNFRGAWWYHYCHSSNLNGLYLNGTHESYADGINWETWKGFGYSAKTADMKIRPI